MITAPLYVSVLRESGLKTIYCVMCSRLTVSETDSIRKESYKQQQVVHFMVERSPSQTLRLGSNSGTMTGHQLPFFNTSRDVHHECAEQQPAVLRKAGVDRQEVTAITRELSKPASGNFRASSLMSSPREISHRVQRREWSKKGEGF